jgi:hypothetical protein
MFKVIRYDKEGHAHLLDSFYTEEEALSAYAAYEALYDGEAEVDIIELLS